MDRDETVPGKLADMACVLCCLGPHQRPHSPQRTQMGHTVHARECLSIEVAPGKPESGLWRFPSRLKVPYESLKALPSPALLAGLHGRRGEEVGWQGLIPVSSEPLGRTSQTPLFQQPTPVQLTSRSTLTTGRMKQGHR